MSKDKVKVKETKNGKLKVTNLTSKKIPCIRVFYKFYENKSEAYVGGIAYTAKITDLKAKESIEIQPSHYEKGGSKVIMVRTYDTKD